MKGTRLAVRFALSPAGAAIDRLCVRTLGHSPVVWLFTRSDGVPYNRPLLLTTTGRSTGRARHVVLPCFEVAPGQIAVVGSRGGLPRDPHWARNLLADPRARVHLRRRSHRARARLVAGEERARLWDAIVTRSPVYARYQARAAPHREIPVFVLELEASGSAAAQAGPPPAPKTAREQKTRRGAAHRGISPGSMRG